MTKNKLIDWRKADFEGLRIELGKIKWATILINNDVERQWETFKTLFNRVQEKYILPKGKNKLNTYETPWMDKDIRKQLRVRKEAHIKG